MIFSLDEILVFSFRAMGYQGSMDFMENLILKGIIEAISSMEVSLSLEEKIRDSLVYYLKTQNTKIKQFTTEKFLFLDSERRQDISETEKSKTDISFSMSGFEFVLECKILKFADKKYIEEGLRRFIELKYAEKDDFAGMLGFIVAGNPEKIV
ncbi:MAG: hypothetical protein NW226_12245 [Microscillaceae bacterium]|nr:hypothetical protein [Microscillaceae bacterium]